jgi:hypothetical protein
MATRQIDSKYVTGTPEIARFDFSRVNAAGVDKTQKRIELAAEGIYKRQNSMGPVTPFDSLTKKQKLDVVAQYLESIINSEARIAIEQKAQEAARANAASDLENNY